MSGGETRSMQEPHGYVPTRRIPVGEVASAVVRVASLSDQRVTGAMGLDEPHAP
jgi:hypothetical protein